MFKRRDEQREEHRAHKDKQGEKTSVAKWWNVSLEPPIDLNGTCGTMSWRCTMRCDETSSVLASAAKAALPVRGMPKLLIATGNGASVTARSTAARPLMAAPRLWPVQIMRVHVLQSESAVCT